jgi:hypothetical protein
MNYLLRKSGNLHHWKFASRFGGQAVAALMESGKTGPITDQEMALLSDHDLHALGQQRPERDAAIIGSIEY